MAFGITPPAVSLKLESYGRISLFWFERSITALAALSNGNQRAFCMAV